MVTHKKSTKSERATKNHQGDSPDQPPNNLPELVADPGEIGGLKFVAYGEVFGVLIAAMAFNNEFFVKACSEFSDILNLSMVERLNFSAEAALFFVSLILVLRWMIATQHEFDLWKVWLKNPFTPVEQKTALITYPIVLGIMPAYPNHIVFTSAFMAVYSFLNYWTQSLCNDHFKRALHKTKETKLNEDHKAVLTVMENYWLNRPQLGKIQVTTFFTCLAFAFALAGKVQQEPQSHRFQLAAYAILILVLCSTEILIARWRHIRDQDIEAALLHPAAGDNS